MSKLIIHNHSRQGDYNALKAVLDVVKNGRISSNENCYCFATSFPSREIRVFADVTKHGTDTFRVFDTEQP